MLSDEMSEPRELFLPRSFSGGTLRRLRVEDLGAFQSYRSIPELGRFQSWTAMSDIETSSFLADMAQAILFTPGDWVQLGIASAHNDELVGDIGIHVSSDGSTGEVGFTLAPWAQGRGIATAAVGQALLLLFELTSVTAVQGITDSRNASSIRLLQRLGFQLHESQATVFRGENCVEDIYVLQR